MNEEVYQRLQRLTDKEQVSVLHYLIGFMDNPTGDFDTGLEESIRFIEGPKKEVEIENT